VAGNVGHDDVCVRVCGGVFVRVDGVCFAAERDYLRRCVNLPSSLVVYLRRWSLIVYLLRCFQNWSLTCGFVILDPWID